MARRSFSMMLAWRYLNPRRAMLSAVALISTTGVAFGVFALVSVMSIYSGLEREVKSRILGFIPHVRLDYAPMVGMRLPVSDWRGTAEAVEKLPGVVDAGAFVQDSLLIDIAGYRTAGTFRGVDSEDPAEVEGISKMLDMEGHPASSSDMGLDDRVVISSKIAKAFGARVGDTVRLLTLRNFEEVERVFKVTEDPPVREKYAEQLATVKEVSQEHWVVNGDKSEYPLEFDEKIYGPLFQIYNEGVREAEQQIIEGALLLLDSRSEDAERNVLVMGREAKEEFFAMLAELETTDVEKMDAEILKGIREVVLPKEAEIIGIYSASQMAMTPDVFMPLHLAQDLAGLGNGVQGVSVRLDDPYQVGPVVDEIQAALPPEWKATTWVSELSDFSALIEQQRVMMYIVLSLIVVVSAFSMTAVMFTVTLQKRREVGVMKALGAAPGQIVRVFAYQGVILGALGAVMGVIGGLLLVRFREGIQTGMRSVGFDPFPADFNGFAVLPAHVNPGEVIAIGVSAFVLCSLAALLPAFFAARSDAAKSLRNL
ncbi:ABC transporter permease [Haloferula chungangensis]|uniref:ABC transporter permease n=1 Tax=Haloferula chungangensis TaxID=1048331 RepID=A0ABW2L6F1_9BACT